MYERLYNIPYKKPKRSVGIPALLHTGEVVLPVETTHKLYKFVKSDKEILPRRLKHRLHQLMTTGQRYIKKKLI
jgi:hypothetical protein